jgi:hypothetical protein
LSLKSERGRKEGRKEGRQEGIAEGATARYSFFASRYFEIPANSFDVFGSIQIGIFLAPSLSTMFAKAANANPCCRRYLRMTLQRKG